MAETRAVINVDINTSPAAAALRSLQGQLNAFTTALNRNNAEQALASKGIQRQLMSLVNTSKFFTAEMVKMQTGAAQLDKTLSKGQVTMSQFFSAKFKKDGLEASRVLSLAHARASALQTQFVATAGAANGFREAIAIRPLHAFNAEAAVSAERLVIQRAMLQQATTSMINFGKNTQWAGRQLMVGFTVPLTIFAATAGRAFMDIEKQAVAFKKVYGDAFTPPEELQRNLEAVKELSSEFTKYGIAVSDTMNLAAQAAAAGAKNADLIDATTEATRLATLGQLDQQKALETTIALQSAFALSGEKLAKSINFMNMVENQTVLTLQDLTDAIPRVAPVINGLGGSVEDMTIMLTAMKEGGITAAQGANALKSGLASLINPTDRAVERLQKMGISLNNIVQTNRGDLMGTIQDFARALQTVDEFQRQQALETVFGKFQYARLGALFNNIIKDGSQASRAMDAAAMSAEGLAATANKELRMIEDSPAIKFTAAMEKLKLAIAPVGEMFVKMATPILNFLSAIAEKFNELPDFAKNFAALGTVIVGIVIPAGTMFLGLLMNLIGTLTKFGHLSTIFVKGFAQGGIKKAIENVTQATRYMSISEIDAANAAQQLGGATQAVNAALLDQISPTELATSAITGLAGAYDVLAQNMREAALVGGLPMQVPGASMMRAGSQGSMLYRPLPIVARNKGGSIPYLSGGGKPTVPGLGNTDTVPAMLTPGEFVVNKKATEQNLGLLHAINSGDVQYRNMGGGIARAGRSFYGVRPNPFSAAAQEAMQRQQQFESSRSAIANIWGLPATVARSRTTSQASRIISGSRSKDLYNALSKKNTKGAELLKLAVSLGLSPEELGLKAHGNLVLAMSKKANSDMRDGVLSKSSLLSELSSSAYSPVEQQIQRYFGRSLDYNLFDSIYRQEVAKLPETGITNELFEKATRNALRRYMSDSATGFSREQRKSFLRDILAGDTVRGGAKVADIRRILNENGIDFEEKGSNNIYATINGELYNFGDLTSRKIDELGRSEGLLRYDKLMVDEGLERLHANKGGMIPGVQYFSEGSQARELAHLDDDLEIPKDAKEMFHNLQSTEGVKAKNAFVASYPKWVNQQSRAGTLNKKDFIEYLMLFDPEDYRLLFDEMNVPEEDRKELAKQINNKIIKDLEKTKNELISDDGRKGTDKFSLVGKSFFSATPRKYRTILSRIRSTVAEIREPRPGSTRGHERRFRTTSDLAIVKAMATVAKKTSPDLTESASLTWQRMKLAFRRNTGGIIPGGPVDKARSFYGKYNAKTIELFTKWISSQPSQIAQFKAAPQQFSGGFKKSQAAEILQRSTWLKELPEAGSTMSLGSLASFSPRDTDVVRHLADSQLQKDAESAGQFLSMDQRRQREDALRLRKIMEMGPENVPSWAPERRHIGRSGQGLEAWIKDTQRNIESRKSSIKKSKKIIRDRKSMIPTIIELDTPNGTIMANLDDIVSAENQKYLGRQVNEKERILHNAMVEVLSVADDENGIKRIKARLLSSEYPQFSGETPAGQSGSRKGYYTQKVSGLSYDDIAKQTIAAKARASTVSGKNKDDFLFSRDDQGKLNRDPFDLINFLRLNPNISDKDLANIAKYHGSRIRNGVFGRLNDRGFRIVDRQASTWREIANILGERGHPVIQRKNAGGFISPTLRASGGNIVPGQGNKDTVPAMLTPGEFVINKKATMDNLGLLHAINAGNVQGYKLGGIVKKNDGFYVEGPNGMQSGPFQSRSLARKESRSIISQAGGKRMGMGGTRMAAGMGIGALGGSLMMAPMIPGIGENQGLSQGLGMAGMGLSLVSMFATLPAPIAAVAAALTAVSGAAVFVKTKFDELARQSADLGAQIGGASNRMEKISEATGYQFARGRVQDREFRFTKEEMSRAGEFSSFFESESGQKMIEELKNLTSEERYKEVGSIISMAIADGMDIKTAKAYGDAIAFYANDSMLKFRIGADFKRGEFQKGSTAMINLIEERAIAAAEKIKMPKAPDAVESPTSRALGTSGTVNLIGEGALSLLGPIYAQYKFTNEMLEEQGNIFERFVSLDKGQLLKDVLPISSFVSLAKSAKEFAMTVKASSAVIGSSIQTLKELDNAEALIIEERRKGIISADEYNIRMARIRKLQDQQAQRLQEAFTVNPDIGLKQQAISSQLVLAGFSGDLATAISNQVNIQDIGTRLFGEQFDEATATQEQKDVISQVMGQVLSGITPDNAASKLEEIETIYANIAEELLAAAEKGLSSAEVKKIVFKEQVENFVKNTLFPEEIDVSGGRIAAEKRKRETEKISKQLSKMETEGAFQSVGGFAPVSRELAGFEYSSAARNIVSSRAETERLVGMMKELEKYKEIDIEILMRTEDNRDPADVAKDVEKAIKAISKLKLKGISNEIKAALPSAQEFVNIARNAGIEFGKIPAEYQKVADITKELDPKGKGSVKTSEVSVDIITRVFGKEANAEGILNALQSVFPKQIDPIFIPLVLALQNPEVLSIINQGGVLSQQLMAAIAAGQESFTYTQGGFSGVPGEEITVDIKNISGDVTPSPTGKKPPGGGGGGGQKSIIEQLKEQFKMLKDIFDGMSKFVKSKTGEFKGIIAGPFGPEFIEYLKSQGEQGVKLLKEGGEKLKEAYNEFKKVQTQQAANFAQTFPATLMRRTKDIRIENQFRGKLARKGFDQDTQDQFIEGIGGVEGIRRYNELVNKRNELKAKGKELSKEELDQLKAINQAMKLGGPAAKQLFAAITKKEVADNLREMRKETDDLSYLLSLGYTKEQADDLLQMGVNSSMTAREIANLNDELKVLAARTASLRELEINYLSAEGQRLAGEEKIRQLEYEVELIKEIDKDEKMAALYVKEGVSNHEDLLAIYERQASMKARELELEQRKLEPIDEQIKNIEEQIDKTEKSYEAQIEALDKILEAESEIYAIRERTLNLADALSRGDVAAAAQAALDLERERASQRATDQRSLLEQQRQQSIKSLEDQITIQKDKRKLVEAEITRLQREQRVIADQIYNVQFIISEQAFRLQNTYGLGNNALKELTNQLKLAKLEQEELAKAAERALKALQDAEALKGKPSTAPAPAPAPAPAAASATSFASQAQVNAAHQAAIKGSPMAHALLAPSLVQANTAARKIIGYRSLPGFGIQVPIYAAYGGKVSYKGSREPAPGFAMGGKVKYFANGGRPFGSDTVPAMLTPGEFVVRKSMAKAYGPLLESINGNVFPRVNMNRAMPSSSAQKSGSMYNYNVNVTLNGSDMDPNDVANVVMQKIKMKENMNVRNYNYRG